LDACHPIENFTLGFVKYFNGIISGCLPRRVSSWGILDGGFDHCFLQILSNLANDYGDSIHGADSADGKVRSGLFSPVSSALKK
jgi:1,4-dihydroxy-2-naphthoate octaprenyltransferase